MAFISTHSVILLPAECCAFFCHSKYYLSGTSACLAVNIFYVFLSVLAKPKLTVVRSASLTFSVSVLEVKWEVQSRGKSHQSCYFYVFVLLMLQRDLLKLYWAYFPRKILAQKFHHLLSVLLDSWFIMYTCSIGAENLSITRISALTLFSWWTEKGGWWSVHVNRRFTAYRVTCMLDLTDKMASKCR